MAINVATSIGEVDMEKFVNTQMPTQISNEVANQLPTAITNNVTVGGKADKTYVDSQDIATQTLLSKKKVGTFTRDISLASGIQAITGIGFKPTAGHFLAGIEDVVGKISIGFSDGVTSGVVGDTYGNSPNTWHLTSSSCIYIMFNSADGYYGKISTWDIDGFTITWTKMGSPTGIATIQFLVEA